MTERTLLDPSEHWRAAMALLARGEWEMGWRLWETRPINMGGRAAGKPNLSVPEWSGQPIKALLILPEQGFGDQIMFARYAPYLRDQGVATTIMCHPLLETLFQSLGAPVLSAIGRVPLPPVDAWALGPSLPYLCKTTLETVPPAPYLSATPRTQGGVGLALKGNPGHPNDAQRSLPPELAQRFLALPGAVDLDPAATGAKTFLDTAEIVAGLDVVVAVDTAIAHLAGAMGKRCLLLLAHAADWRWMLDRPDSPWYPSLQLLRQAAPGAWEPVVEQALRLAADATQAR